MLRKNVEEPKPKSYDFPAVNSSSLPHHTDSALFSYMSLKQKQKKKTVASNNALQLKFFLTQSISWNIILIQFYTKNKQTNKKKSTRN